MSSYKTYKTSYNYKEPLYIPNFYPEEKEVQLFITIMPKDQQEFERQPYQKIVNKLQKNKAFFDDLIIKYGIHKDISR